MRLALRRSLRDGSTLQHALGSIAQQLLETFEEGVMAVEGIKVFLVPTGTKGDLPFLAKAYTHSRAFNRFMLCPWCLCDCSPDVPFEDPSVDAEWASTVPAPAPYDENAAPTLARAPYLGRTESARRDLFHIGPLGIMTLG